MLCIVFYMNLQLKYVAKYLFLPFFVNTRGYPWISRDIKKLCRYLHNGYLTDMSMGTRQIFIP